MQIVYGNPNMVGYSRFKIKLPTDESCSCQKALLFATTANEPCQTKARKGAMIGLGGIVATERTCTLKYMSEVKGSLQA
jgi:hypothetical protein